jgi:hypothetical protein
MPTLNVELRTLNAEVRIPNANFKLLNTPLGQRENDEDRMGNDEGMQ